MAGPSLEYKQLAKEGGQKPSEGRTVIHTLLTCREGKDGCQPVANEAGQTYKCLKHVGEG